MYLLKRCIVMNLVLLSVGNKCQDSVYDYAIEVPKYMCDRKESLKTGVTTIRLSGKDAKKLQYEFAVNYKNITFCKRNQKCTLTAWRAVRSLEKYLKSVCASQNNFEEISINNTLLIPGIQYVLNVSIANNGKKVDNKEFILECANSTKKTVNRSDANSTKNTVNGSVTHSEQNSRGSLVLHGSNVTYRDTIYILNAEVIDFTSNCSYYFKWEILDDVENVLLKEPTKGSELQFFFSILNAAEQYTVRCSLINAERNSVLAMALQNVKLLKRDMILKLAISTLVLGLKQPFQLHAFVKDVDNANEKIEIEWLCQRENPTRCFGFEAVHSNYKEIQHLISLESHGFVATGRYNITVVVKKGDIAKRDSCEIRVVADGFARIYVGNVAEPVDPTKEIEVPAYVSKLVAWCTLQWTSVQRISYTYLDSKIFPGNISAITNITLKEDEFLNEIDEYSNGTVDVDYNLKIPAPKEGWKGLSGNSSYLFRLNVTCPVQEDENSDEDAEPLLLQNYVTLYADVAVHTDPSPVLNSLEVIPKRGMALKTLFNFIYQANGSTVDNPVLYKFGYFLNNEIVFVSNLLGVSSAKSVLPYVAKGVKTMLEGCNSYSLCAQIFGPVVITELPPISLEEQANLMKQLHELMNREEYYKVFTYSLAILETYNNINDKNILETMQNYISNLTSNEIKRLLMQSADGETAWRVPANKLIKNIGILLNNFLASEILLNNVVALRNELSRKDVLKLKVGTGNVNHISRKLLMVNKSERFRKEAEKVTLEEVKNYVMISELIITTSPDKKRVRQEKQNLLNQIDKFMQKLCATLYEKSQAMNLELRTVILSVEKINKNTFSRYTHILYADNAWNLNGRIKLEKCFAEKLKANDQLCLGKAAFKNYLNRKGIVYMVKVFSAELHDQLDFEDTVCDSVLVLPVDEKQLKEKEAKCALWKRRWIQSQCKTLQVTKTIQCTCSSLGYYSLDYTTSVTRGRTLSAIVTNNEMLNNLQTVATEMFTAPNTMLPVVQANTISSKVTESLIMSADTESVRYSELVIYTESVVQAESETYTDESIEENVTIADFPPTVSVLSNNTLLASFYIAKDGDDVIFYFIIGFSIAGIAILIYGIRYLLSKDKSVPTGNFPKYALLYHQEMLQDLPNSN